jgi:hypothetical protein
MIAIMMNIILAMLFSAYEKPESDLIFSHRAHFGERDIDCQTCHQAALSMTANDVNMPGHNECSDCHSVENAPDDCRLCHAHPDNPRGIDIPERELIFSHKSHLGENPKSDDCLACHTGIERLESHADAAGYPSMAYCFKCHDAMSASAECEACHTQATAMANLVHPPDWNHSHQFAATVEQRQTCAPCHQAETFCSDCHAGDNLVETVHDLNFRFNHGIDAKGKESNCQSCHEFETFCSECHSQEDAIPFTHFYPAWNPRTNPGTHADFARKDMESCASCHDEQSFTCGQAGCHGDTDGIRGTDPDIHPSDFMDSEQGPWHDDPGFQCFQCHSNTHRAGSGFCGYCHGENED